jgi:uncharacterized protein YPO0396
MKILQKIRFINWHFFEDATFEVKNNVVIFGENACGKSTIIDAIHYVLSGGDCDFNKAANSSNSSRSVFSYMKARIGKENQEYARSQPDVITHIALQFIDSYNRQPLVVGVVLQITADQQPTNRFYSFKGAAITDDLFYSDKEETTIRNGDNFFDYCHENGIDIQSLDNDGRAKTCIERMTAVLEVSQTYPSLLEKAISFSSLGNIDDFARKFLFKEDRLPIETLVKPALDYQRIDAQLAAEEKKVDALELVSQLAPKYQAAVRDQLIYSLVIAQEEVEIQKASLKSKEDELEKHRLVLQDNKKQDSALDKQKEILDNRERELSNNNPAIDNLKAARNLEANTKKALDDAKTASNSLAECVSKEKQLANEFDIPESFSKAFETKNYDDFLGSARQYRDDFREFSDSLNRQFGVLENDYLNKATERDSLARDVEDLKRNINCPSPVRYLIEQIKEECFRHGIKESELYVIPVSDVLEVTDESWRAALEGLLGVNRFDLLVPNAAYRVAYNVFLNHPEIKDYFGFGVLNEEDLFQEPDHPGSVSVYLKSDNKWAINYAKKVLGDIKPVDMICDSTTGEKFVTKDGLFFDGCALRRLLPEQMYRPYLGQAAKRLALEKTEKEYAEVAKSAQNLLAEKTSVKGKIDKINRESKAVALASWVNVFFQVDQAEANHKTAERQLAILENDQSLLSAQAALEELKKDRASYDAARKSLKDKEERDNQKQGQLIESQNNINKALASATTGLTTLMGTLPEDVKTADLVPYKKGERGEKLISAAEQAQSGLLAQQTDLGDKLSKLFGEYNNQFGGDVAPTIDSLDDYLAIYYKAKTIDITNLKPQVEEAHQNMEKVFKEDFAVKLMAKIQGAEDLANRLNSVLKKYQFGTEKGTFQLNVKTTDAAEYKEVAVIMKKMGEKVLGNAGLYDSLDEDEKKAFDKIFAVLLENHSGVDNSKLIAGYCDYRNYMSYDIRESWGDDSASSYKHNENSFSGGETQTPFYVMVAAAFGSGFLERNAQKSSPCGLVMLDEAFNTMDEGRIKATIEFYKQLNIQLIICVPTDRSALLTGKVDTSIALVRKGDQVAWYTTYHD